MRQQVTDWLAQQDTTGIRVDHDITAIVSNAKSHQRFHVPNPNDPGAGTDAGQVFLNFLTDTNYQGIADSSMTPPSCADPQGLWSTFLNDASTASQDTSGTSQADSDVQSVLTDFASLNAELASTSGVQAKGYPGTP